MTWIKSDWRFEEGRAVLFVTQKQMLIERMVFSILTTSDDPVGLENAVRELIGKYRPELSQCSIYSMDFDPSWGRWQFGVAHPSLPRVKPFDQAPFRPLDPAYERDLEASKQP